MGSKNNPGAFDCYAAAHPDEPMFVLLGRDPDAPALVRKWAAMREARGETAEKVAEARSCAEWMEMWAARKNGGEMTDRLSDERLKRLREAYSLRSGLSAFEAERECSKDAVSAIDELLALRAKLAAGPVMPEVPSDDQWNRMADRLFDGRLCDVYAAIRDALLEMQAYRIGELANR